MRSPIALCRGKLKRTKTVGSVWKALAKNFAAVQLKEADFLISIAAAQDEPLQQFGTKQNVPALSGMLLGHEEEYNNPVVIDLDVKKDQDEL